KSEHPLAKAIVAYCGGRSTDVKDIAGFKALPGNGLTGMLDGEELTGGSFKFISSKCDVPNVLKDSYTELAENGKTPLLFAKGAKVLGMIAVADTAKEESPDAIEELKNMGIKVVMLTGDNEKTAAAVGKTAGVDKVIAGVLPDGKEEIIRLLQEKGKVAMVGDGINDAPALTRADTGIAIGAGTDVAIDAADVVLMKSELTDVSAAVRLSRATVRNIHENLFWAFFYNVICIPLAIGLYQSLFGWNFELKPVVGALAMSFSSVTVCLNALRLNLFNVHDPSGDRKIKNGAEIADVFEIAETEEINNSLEDAEMTRTLNIEGMMCTHCEATVKKALEALDGVVSAEVSYEKGTAVVTMNADVADELLTKAVEDKDYKVLSVA
ncbi:MAG: HAD-IC family P-type ATPase, partial [Oscillospiraceae bacterium]|nr:HAD-IC family P-type ATPase [Oscillospiraceae bacterium]